MSTFINGPAAGENLLLRRTPLLLRIAQNGPNFTALDLPSDEPEEMEIIYIYQRITGDTYQLSSRQITDCEARDRELWRAWAYRIQAILKQPVI